METAKPAPRFTALDEVGEGEEWSGDEEDAVEEVRSPQRDIRISTHYIYTIYRSSYPAPTGRASTISTKNFPVR